MKAAFVQNLTAVTFAHIGCIVCILVLATVPMPGCRRESRMILPVQFFADMSSLKDDAMAFLQPARGQQPPAEPVQQEPAGPVAEPVAEPPREEPQLRAPPPVPVPPKRKTLQVNKETPKPPVRKRSAGQGVNKSQDKRRTNPVASPAVKPPGRRLSEKDIRDMMLSGISGRGSPVSIGTPGVGGAPTDADMLYFAILKETLDQAWVKPSYGDVGNVSATVSFHLTANGTIYNPVLVKSSGNPVMDASVMQAVDDVKRFDGLPQEFTRNHRDIQVVFKLREGV